MPVINIDLSDDEYDALRNEYQEAVSNPSHRDTTGVAPAFESWLRTRLFNRPNTAVKRELNDIRTFAAIEKVITSLQLHGFALAHLSRQEAPPTAALPLAESLVKDLNLSQQQLKRIEELVHYYAKGAKEVADLAHVGVTNRAYGALHDAYRELTERTAKALDHLGEHRAVGRVEGAAAVLVSLRAMTREAAREKTETFKQQARDPKKRID